MKREIKFRAFDTRFKVMIPNVAVFDNENIVIVDVLINELYSDDIFDERTDTLEDGGPEHYLMTGGFELMQYTGLKDKEGTEVYEGDIIKVTSLDKEYPLINEIHEVRWPSYSVVLYPGDLQEDCDDMQYLTQGDYEFEQIGNIYENPELLTPKP